MTDKKQKTSFGYLEPKILNREKEVVSEIAFFEQNGKPHHHDQWEICYILEGAGLIKIKYPKGIVIHQVREGNMIEIPPFCPHWMEVNKNFESMKILLVYTEKNSGRQLFVHDNFMKP